MAVKRCIVYGRTRWVTLRDPEDHAMSDDELGKKYVGDLPRPSVWLQALRLVVHEGTALLFLFACAYAIGKAIFG
jgi:hypothetical protein